MYKYGKRSLTRLKECDDKLQELMQFVIKTSDQDLTILCGHRSKTDQNRAYDQGHSKLKYPRSKHNQFPSQAVDICPYPVDWDDISRFESMVDHIKECAKELGIKIRCGADWRMRDYPHIELIIV